MELELVAILLLLFVLQKSFFTAVMLHNIKMSISPFHITSTHMYNLMTWFFGSSFVCRGNIVRPLIPAGHKLGLSVIQKLDIRVLSHGAEE